MSEEVIEGIIKAEKPPSIVQMMTTRRKADHLNWKVEIIEALVGDGDLHALYNSRRAFNIFRKRRDFASHNGWSLTVDYKDLAALEGSDTGLFMVNLTKVSDPPTSSKIFIYTMIFSVQCAPSSLISST